MIAAHNVMEGWINCTHALARHIVHSMLNSLSMNKHKKTSLRCCQHGQSNKAYHSTMTGLKSSGKLSATNSSNSSTSSNK